MPWIAQLSAPSLSVASSCPPRPMPALEKKISTGPYFFSASEISRLTSASWPMSPATPRPPMSRRRRQGTGPHPWLRPRPRLLAPSCIAPRDRLAVADAAGRAGDDADLVLDLHETFLLRCFATRKPHCMRATLLSWARADHPPMPACWPQPSPPPSSSTAASSCRNPAPSGRPPTVSRASSPRARAPSSPNATARSWAAS